MVGVARYSASDFYSEKELSKAGLKYDDIFRPQVNDIPLRAAMLNETQIEAAVLPEPYATVARVHGHKVLHVTHSPRIQKMRENPKVFPGFCRELFSKKC